MRLIRSNFRTWLLLWVLASTGCDDPASGDRLEDDGIASRAVVSLEIWSTLPEEEPVYRRFELHPVGSFDLTSAAPTTGNFSARWMSFSRPDELTLSEHQLRQSLVMHVLASPGQDPVLLPQNLLFGSQHYGLEVPEPFNGTIYSFSLAGLDAGTSPVFSIPYRAYESDEAFENQRANVSDTLIVDPSRHYVPAEDNVYVSRNDLNIPEEAWVRVDARAAGLEPGQRAVVVYTGGSPEPHREAALVPLNEDEPRIYSAPDPISEIYVFLVDFSGVR